MQQLILGTANAIWWVTEPHWRVNLLCKMGFLLRRLNFQNSSVKKFDSENESKIKTIPCNDFLCSINFRVKIF